MTEVLSSKKLSQNREETFESEILRWQRFWSNREDIKEMLRQLKQLHDKQIEELVKEHHEELFQTDYRKNKQIADLRLEKDKEIEQLSKCIGEDASIKYNMHKQISELQAENEKLKDVVKNEYERSKSMNKRK